MAYRTDSWTSTAWRLQPRGVCEDEYKRMNCLFPPGRIAGLVRDNLMSSHIQTSRRSSEWSCCSFTLRGTSWDLVRMLPGDLPGEVSWASVAIADRPDITCLSGLYFTSVLKQERQADLLQLLPLWPRHRWHRSRQDHSWDTGTYNATNTLYKNNSQKFCHRTKNCWQLSMFFLF